jgi:hypothetical protein
MTWRALFYVLVLFAGLAFWWAVIESVLMLAEWAGVR